MRGVVDFNEVEGGGEVKFRVVFDGNLYKVQRSVRYRLLGFEWGVWRDRGVFGWCTPIWPLPILSDYLLFAAEDAAVRCMQFYAAEAKTENQAAARCRPWKTVAEVEVLT